jgi:hypothetical protein
VTKALVLAVDDADDDGTFTWDGASVSPPDVLVGVATHVLLFHVVVEDGAESPLSAGLHLGSLDFCGAGGARDLRLDTLVRLSAPLPDLGPADQLVDLCEVPSAVLGAAGEGPCSSDLQGEECGACNDAAFGACRDDACAAESDTLSACAAEAGCVADGAWDGACVMDACGNDYVAYDVCIAACWDPYGCF